MCVFHAWSGELDIQIIAHVNMKFALAPSVKELTHAFAGDNMMTFSPSMVWFRGVYTMEARNGFRGVHHGRGFWIFVVYTMEGDFAISWCIHHGS